MNSSVSATSPSREDGPASVRSPRRKISRTFVTPRSLSSAPGDNSQDDPLAGPSPQTQKPPYAAWSGHELNYSGRQANSTRPELKRCANHGHGIWTRSSQQNCGTSDDDHSDFKDVAAHMGFHIMSNCQNPAHTLMGPSRYDFGTVLNVGASCGQFGFETRTKFARATFHCFEPTPAAFAALSAWAGPRHSRARLPCSFPSISVAILI